MTDEALHDEVRQLRAQVARLEAREKAGAGVAGMEGFNQLNDAIVEGRVQSWAWRLQPRWQRNLALAGVLTIWMFIILSFGMHH